VFAVLNFLDNGKKTAEQEVAPMRWVREGRQPEVYWPRDRNITRKKVDALVKEQSQPNDEEYELLPVRILISGCEYIFSFTFS
jgi:hypothetical protein